MAQDYDEAYRLIKLAAEQGFTEADFFMGLKYARGIGVVRDTAEAARWYERAAAKGLDVKTTLAEFEAIR